MKKLSRIIIVSLSILVMPTIAVPPAYEITDLGAMGVADAINDNGHVVGGEYYYDGTSLQDTTRLQGYYTEVKALNNHNHLAGSVAEYKNGQWKWVAFSYNGSAIKKIGNLGGSSGGAIAINDSGQMAGSSYLAGDSLNHAFFYDGTTMHDIGTFGGSHSTAWDINNNGQVVGRANTEQGPSRAFLYDDTGIHDIGTLGGNWSDAFSINDSGQITGEASGVNYVHAFFYDGTDMHDLGSLEGDSGHSAGWGINNSGQIVGYSSIPNMINVTHAFVYDDVSGMLDLNNLISPDSGWVLSNALDINSHGQIVGGGLFNGQQHAYLLTPIPEPATLSLLALGGLALLRKRK